MPVDARTLPVSRVAQRLRCSRDTVMRLVESGTLRGYQLTPNGWWRILEKSVLEYEADLLQKCGLEQPSTAT
jgi:excisionase family DNA binding protein